MKKTSKQLQNTSAMILDTIGGGMEKSEVKAIRGVGYAVLALLQFLRESEQTQCACEPDCSTTVITHYNEAFDVMQEALDGRTKDN